MIIEIAGEPHTPRDPRHQAWAGNAQGESVGDTNGRWIASDEIRTEPGRNPGRTPRQTTDVIRAGLQLASSAWE